MPHLIIPAPCLARPCRSRPPPGPRSQPLAVGVKWDQVEGLPAGAGSVGPRTAGRQLRMRAVMTEARGTERRGGVEAAGGAHQQRQRAEAARGRGLPPVVEDSTKILGRQGSKGPLFTCLEPEALGGISSGTPCGRGREGFGTAEGGSHGECSGHRVGSMG